MSLELINRGYKVWIAARELHNIHHLFYDIDVNTVQQPALAGIPQLAAPIQLSRTS